MYICVCTFAMCALKRPSPVCKHVENQLVFPWDRPEPRRNLRFRAISTYSEWSGSYKNVNGIGVPTEESLKTYAVGVISDGPTGKHNGFMQVSHCWTYGAAAPRRR